eukprot:gb/GEZN01002549.1/.p1 GENE.gb/GEZN01002549.1/~~gb/GEZN01002549.1/.p1  ORF type:complete len:418 (-),score=73.95 gb/GEZN01002549.1/:1127-2380(-)
MLASSAYTPLLKKQLQHPRGKRPSFDRFGWRAFATLLTASIFIIFYLSSSFQSFSPLTDPLSPSSPSSLFALNSSSSSTACSSPSHRGPPCVLITGYGAFSQFQNNPSEAVARRLDGLCTPTFCVEGWTLPVNREGAMRTAEALLQHHSVAGSKVAPWAVVLHLGLEDQAKGLTLETMAMNVLAVTTGSLLQHVPATNSLLACPPRAVPPTVAKLQKHLPRIQPQPSHSPALTPLPPPLGQVVKEDGWVFDEVGRQILPPINADAPCLLATTADLSAFSLEQHGLSPEEYWSRDAGTFFCNEVFYRTLHAVRTLRLQPRGPNCGPSATRHTGNDELSRVHDKVNRMHHFLGYDGGHPSVSNFFPGKQPGIVKKQRVGGHRMNLLPVMFVHLPEPALLPVDEAAQLILRLTEALLPPV